MAFGGYEVGRTYNRRRDIHGRFGGQRQGGICTPKDYPVVIAFTGASGRHYGYADGWAADGVYRYFGEGQSGDMSWKGGNLAIRDHAARGEDLLLFQTVGDGNVRFFGEFVCAGYDLERAPDGEGAMRQSIVFNLVPVSDLDTDNTPAGEQGTSVTADLQTLRRRALEAVSTPPQADRATAKRNVYERSREIRAYVLHLSSRSAAPRIWSRITFDGWEMAGQTIRVSWARCHGANGPRINERLQTAVSSKEVPLEAPENR